MRYKKTAVNNKSGLMEDTVTIELEYLDAKGIEEVFGFDHPEIFYIRIKSKRKLFHIGAIVDVPDNVPGRDEIIRDRGMAVKNILALYYYQYSSGEKGIATIETDYRDFEKFIRWANENYFWEIFSIEKSPLVVIQRYIKHLETLERSGELDISSAVRRQNTAIRTVEEARSDESDLQGLHLLYMNGRRSQSTSLPDIDNLDKSLAISDVLFNQITDFLLDFKEYPFLLKLPKESCWVFPAKTWIMPIFKRDIRGELTNPSWAWGYESGTINSIEYLEGKYNFGISAVKKTRDRALETLRKSNENSRHHSRLNLAAIATRAFLFKFNNVLGANRSFYEKLQWDDDFVVTKAIAKGGVSFVNVKSRANREVRFTITKEFEKDFRKYLKLRAYFKGDNSIDLLFFQLDKKGCPSPITPQFIQVFFEQVNNLIDPNVFCVSNRKLRANKGDHSQNNNSQATTAELLQNTIPTAQRSYSSGSESKQSSELTAYYDLLSERVRKEDERVSSQLMEISIGGCSSHRAPKALDGNCSVVPDCKSPEGCLWCENYFIHADRVDIHKLLSMRYVICEIGSLVYKTTALSAELNKSISRVDVILSKMSSISESLKLLVDEISEEVESGTLTEYWEWKLAQLFKLGVIN